MAVRGAEAETLLHYALTSDVTALGDGQSQPTHLFGPDLDLDATLERVETGRYLLRFATNEAAADAAEWLQALSDGYAQFDDVYACLLYTSRCV